MAFQERCVNRMRSFKREGVTIVFVSHNLQAVTELCDMALYLKRQVRALGPAGEVIDKYVRDSFVASEDKSTTTDLRIVSAELFDADGGRVEGPVAPGQRLRFSVVFESATSIADAGLAFRLLRSTDQLLVYDGQFSQRDLGLILDGPQRFTIDFAFEANLTRGQYYFDLLVGHTPTQRQLARLTPAGHLTIAETRTWGGVANLMVRTSVDRSTPRELAESAGQPV